VNTPDPLPGAYQGIGRVTANRPVSSGLIRMDLVLARPLDFSPGQFAMLNLAGPSGMVFSRPFSILAADGQDVSFLYRVVGRGTAAFADLGPGAPVSFLGPLGRPFPARTPGQRAVLLAGGVGLPPLHDWLARHGRPGDLACFGAREGHDVPWNLLDERWTVCVEDPDGLDGHPAVTGLVTAPVAGPELPRGRDRILLLSCGPRLLLRAAADLAAAQDWECWLSLEEHMGCGYGVCKGCVVQVRVPGIPGSGPGSRNATCCQEGPVFRAEDLIWT